MIHLYSHNAKLYCNNNLIQAEHFKIVSIPLGLPLGLQGPFGKAAEHFF